MIYILQMVAFYKTHLQFQIQLHPLKSELFAQVHFFCYRQKSFFFTQKSSCNVYTIGLEYQL